MNDPVGALAEKLANDVSQAVSYRVGDILDSYPYPMNIVALAALQSILTASLPLMSDLDRKLFDSLVTRTTVTTIPSSMDPRKKGDTTS
jgi:hypothetical protein